jgi:hypothetical protein
MMAGHGPFSEDRGVVNLLPKADKPGMPSPHGRGYLFGTNVDGMKAYNAMIAGNAKDAIVPWAAGKPPVDATEFSTSYAWASGSIEDQARQQTRRLGTLA